MIADKDRVPRFELSLDEAAELANALRALAYQEPLSGAKSKLWARLNTWLRENGATKDGNGWWRPGPGGLQRELDALLAEVRRRRLGRDAVLKVLRHHPGYRNDRAQAEAVIEGLRALLERSGGEVA